MELVLKILDGFILFFIVCLEAASGGVLLKKVFLEISQNSQENTCARHSLLKF